MIKNISYVLFKFKPFLNSSSGENKYKGFFFNFFHYFNIKCLILKYLYFSVNPKPSTL